MLQKLTNSILLFFGKIGIGLIPSILIGIIGLAAIISFLSNTLNYAIQYMKTPTPIWATIVFGLAIYIYFHIQNTKRNKFHSYKHALNHLSQEQKKCLKKYKDKTHIFTATDGIVASLIVSGILYRATDSIGTDNDFNSLYNYNIDDSAWVYLKKHPNLLK